MILDLLLDRSVIGINHAEFILDLIEEGELQGFITTKDLSDIENIVRHLKGIEGARDIKNRLSSILYSVEIDTVHINEARESSLTDFDSALLLSCLKHFKLDAIVTFETQKYKNSKNGFNYLDYRIQNIFEASEFLRHYDYYKDVMEADNLDEMDELDLGDIDFFRSKLTQGESGTTSDVIKISGWCIENYSVQILKDCLSQAVVTLWNPSCDKKIEKRASGHGAVEAVCKALNMALSEDILNLERIHLKSIRIQNIEPELNSRVLGRVILEYNGNLYKGESTHKDTMIAAFYAYAKALNNVFEGKYDDSEIAFEEIVEIHINILSEYAEGNRDFRRIETSGLSLVQENVSGINLSEANLSNAYIYKSILREADLHKANLNHAVLSYTTLSRANLRESTLFKANLEAATLCGADLSGANLRGADFTNADLTQSIFRGADLSNARLEGAKLDGADFREAILDGTDLTQSELSKILLENDDFQRLKLQILSNELDKLSKNLNDIDLHRFTDLVREIELNDEFLRNHICFNEKKYSRQLVFQGKNLTVYIIGWKPQQIATKHHHGTSLDAIRIIQGKMTHWKFPKIDRKDPDFLTLSAFEDFADTTESSEPILEPGEEFGPGSDLILIDRWEPHQMGNTSDEDLVTLHFRYGTPPDDEKWLDKPDRDNPDVSCLNSTTIKIKNKL